MTTTPDQTRINLCKKCTQENCCWNIAKGCRDFTPQPQPPVEPEAKEETTMWDDTCKKIKVPVTKKTAHAPVKQIKCRGIEIEPGVFSGCDTKGGTLKDCPTCNGTGYEIGPDYLSPAPIESDYAAVPEMSDTEQIGGAGERKDQPHACARYPYCNFREPAQISKGECTKCEEQLPDFSTSLLNIEKMLSGLADVAESRSVTLGDKQGKLADGCIDAMESVQVLRNQANGIEIDESDTPANASPVPMH